MYSTKTPSWGRETGFGALAIAAVGSASVAAQIATYPNLAPWYNSLVKPAFKLDLCAGLDNPLCADGIRRLANPAATPNLGSATLRADLVFCSAYAECSMVVDVFWRQQSLPGLINIVPQLLLILATVVAFHRLDKVAAWCVAPLAAWVVFASALNVAIWRLNG
jgi:translocator protein